LLLFQMFFSLSELSSSSSLSLSLFSISFGSSSFSSSSYSSSSSGMCHCCWIISFGLFLKSFFNFLLSFVCSLCCARHFRACTIAEGAMLYVIRIWFLLVAYENESLVFQQMCTLFLSHNFFVLTWHMLRLLYNFGDYFLNWRMNFFVHAHGMFSCICSFRFLNFVQKI